MENHHTFTLINGEFEPKDSRELLFSVFKSKIHFHQMKNFSAQECFGKEDQAALNKIEKLKEALEEVSKLVDLATREGKVLEIKSQVSLRFINEIDS